MKTSVFFFLAIQAATIAQTVQYEGGVFPELADWTRDDRPYPPDRWIENGWFVQETEIRSYDPYQQEDDIYRRSIAAFTGVNPFFAEWRMETDGNHDWFINVAPSALTVSGTMGIRFHFTITRDLVRLIDSDVNEHYFSIGPGVPHVYRVEVNQLSYTVQIDDQQVFAGTIPHSYPGPDSVIVFGARAPNETATTRWDYIRYGKMATPAGPGDTNCDGSINAFDIQPFVTALTSPDEYGQSYPACTLSTADTNVDGSVNIFDIQPFIDILNG